MRKDAGWAAGWKGYTGSAHQPRKDRGMHRRSKPLPTGQFRRLPQRRERRPDTTWHSRSWWTRVSMLYLEGEECAYRR
jgi:hypothetical protein